MRKFVMTFVIFMLVATLSMLMVDKTEEYSEPNTLPRFNDDMPFTPVVSKPAWVDQNNNEIADSLEEEIAERIANGTAQDYASVTVMLKSAPTACDTEDFASFGGFVTTSLWTEATYGFGGMIPYDDIISFTKQCPNMLLIEKEAAGQSTIAYASRQVGARTYVWNTLGLQGDPNSSIAIVDTGIDASHPDFSPGFGDLDFSKKIVGWHDEVNESTTIPYDDDGHGSHVAGLAAGDGFFSVDASGNAIGTYGANLSSISKDTIYYSSGVMVNKTGTITVNVGWATTGTATLSGVVLEKGGKTFNESLWTLVDFSYTPNQYRFYTLTYNVSSTPSGGYDMYHVLSFVTRGTGDLYIIFKISWPYTPPADGFSAWTGIAPKAKLVGVKTLPGTSADLVSGIEWIISNRKTYHITAASISTQFGSEISILDSALVRLVNSGVATIVCAGNYYSGTNKVYTPSSVDEVLTVAAMNQFDNVTDYSAQGGTSRYTGKTVKPDITAPGGSFYAVPLFSADSNLYDADGGLNDVQVNDSASMQGTSMATPIVSGAANIIIQAMGGYTSWNWTRSQALQPKMILLMTATETYPNLREYDTGAYSPKLDRGGKDVHEGYGRLNLDAAVDAILKTYQVGTTVNDSLGKPPTPTDISVLGQRLAWASNVQLVSGFKYNFTLSIPAGADYDLYLYNSTGTTYGEPAIVAKSTAATTGGSETFNVTAPYNGTYYIVVKRATETTGSGNFTLTSSGPVNVTLSTPGLLSASKAVHYTKNGASKTGNISANAFSDYADSGTTLTIDNPINVSTTQRYGTADPTSFLIQGSATFTVNYTLQYRVTVNQTGVGSEFTGTVVTIDAANYSAADLPAVFWWDQSSAHNFAFASPLALNSSRRYVWNSTSGLSILQSGTLMITDPGSVVADYSATSGAAPDIAVISVQPLSSKTVLGRGYSMPINITVMNKGESAETFNVTAYAIETSSANATVIASQTITLTSNVTFTFTWNSTGFDYGNYTISAYAQPVQGETNTQDNNSTTLGAIMVGMPGDVRSPFGVIDMKDISYLSIRFNTNPSSTNWDPNADINGDDRIDMKDISTTAKHFNEHYP